MPSASSAALSSPRRLASSESERSGICGLRVGLSAAVVGIRGYVIGLCCSLTGVSAETGSGKSSASASSKLVSLPVESQVAGLGSDFFLRGALVEAARR